MNIALGPLKPWLVIPPALAASGLVFLCLVGPPVVPVGGSFAPVLPWALALLLGGFFHIWPARRLSAQSAYAWETGFRAFGWLAGLTVGWQTWHGLYDALARWLNGSALETLVTPLAGFASLAVATGLGLLLHALPGWLVRRRLAGHIAADPAWEILRLGGAWLAVALAWSAYAAWDQITIFSLETLTRLLSAGLAATAAYGLPRAALSPPVPSILHWSVPHWPRLEKSPDATAPPATWLVFDRPLSRKTDGLLIERFARAHRDAPLVLAAPVGGDLLGEHGYLADRQGSLKALFPRLEIELSDWRRLLPPAEAWCALEWREVYPSEALLVAAVCSLRGEQDKVVLVNGEQLERWRGVLLEEMSRVVGE